MAKRITVGVISLIVVLLLAACNGAETGIEYYGDKIENDTLRICIDVENINAAFNEYFISEVCEDMVTQIKNDLDIESISLEVLPRKGMNREVALQRLRTEIMAGGGPDVFILNTISSNDIGEYSSALLNFPEINMESGLFLPIDMYMENNTQFTDWNMQTKAVLDAGRTEEGQLIIPMTYTFPVTIIPENRASIPYTTELTMQEILDDPTTAEIGAVMYTGMCNQSGYDYSVYRQTHCMDVLGKFADFKNEKLLFSEEDLHETVSSIRDLYKLSEGFSDQCITFDVGRSMFLDTRGEYFNTEMTLSPHYSRNGGVTASILSYAAINRNTSYPEIAYSIIDYIMQEEMQLTSELYSVLLGIRGIPLYNNAGSAEKPVFDGMTLESDLFCDLLEIKKQITAVNFYTKLDVMLSSLVDDVNLNYSVSEAKISEVYEQMDRMIGE